MGIFGLFSDPLQKGIELMRRKEYDKARDFFQGLIDKQIAVAGARLDLGKCLFHLGDMPGTRQQFHLALDCEPSPGIVAGILEVTNWWMLSSYRHFNGWPAFSPDGKTVAFTSARRDTDGDGRITGQDACGIYFVNIDSGQEECIITDNFHNAQPVFSPDGKKLAYLSARPAEGAKTPAQPALYVLDLASGTETKLLEESFQTKYHVFSPDSKRLVFTCWRPGDKNSGIYSIDIQTKNMETLVPGQYENTFPSLSSKGDLLLYASWHRDTNGDGIINLRDNTAVFVKRLPYGTDTMVIDDRYNNTFPSFSPDARKILYLSARKDTNKDGKFDPLDNAGIYLHDIESGRERCLVNDSFFNKFPVFASGGRQVLFISNWRKDREEHERRDFFENKGIYVLDIESGQIRQLVSDKNYGSRSLAVSPRGDRVAYVSWRQGTNRGLYLASPEKLPQKEELHRWIDANL